ncbi:magnesium chelatase family protein [Microbacteriaceae bacterium MWH-Ta3]|nr:magnesium chelatase family protein [Microbacteriaceae bacterium MWH-Ta3]
MTVGRTRAVSVVGVAGRVVDIEADISSGLPALVLIGLPDAALAESKDRVRSALANSGFAVPPQRITVNLSPASIPKQGSGFDVGIAVAILVGAGHLSADALTEWVHIGELALDGRIRPVPGILPALRAARDAGFSRVVVPHGNRAEAQLVPGLDVRPVASLREVAILHGAECAEIPVEPFELASVHDELDFPGDLSDVVGQPEVVESLIVAAAGGHHMMLLGPPGAGKTMVASRLPGILPELSTEDSLDVTSILSVANSGSVSRLVTRPPFEAPHHSATGVALVGGGSGIIRPGAISRAHCGVLFLDEAPEFSARVLDSLRQPLESGRIVVHRASSVVEFPARCHVILAANPCPCGLGGGDGESCTCTPIVKRRYLGRLSGPLMDRIDIHVAVRRVSAALVREGLPGSVTSHEARERVTSARARAIARWGDINARVRGGVISAAEHRLPRNVTAPLDRALERGALSMRGFDRVIRIAWTLADLDASASPTTEHLNRALFLRKGMS